MLKLVPLGLNGFIPTFNRHTMSYMLIDDSDELIILDAGSGLSRLLEHRIIELISSKKRLNIILSHYHLDHVVGLSYLPAAWSKKPIRLFVPSKPYVDVEAEDAVNKLLSPPLFSLSLDNYPNPTELIPVSTTGLEIGDYTFQFYRLQHPGGSMGIKINNRISYITDTVVNQQYQNFITGSQYLLHEIWMSRDEAQSNPKEASMHSTIEDVINLVNIAKINNLIPIHFNPTWTEERISSAFAKFRNEKTKIILPSEGKIYMLN